MSEHQYYEFQAIDCPLDATAQAALRKISSRGSITAHSFVNIYQWGDFKGDPRRLMEDWFDLFIYWANWGNRTLMLRVPRRYLDPKALKPYSIRNMIEVWTAGDFTIVSFDREPEEAMDDFFGEEDEPTAAPFVALRAEVMRGDRRVFYLGWLIGVSEGHVKETALEPPCPPGLSSLSGALEAFVDFFAIDPDLLAAAADGSADAVPEVDEPSVEALRAFIEKLPDKDKTDFLCRAVLENDPNVRIDIGRRLVQATTGSSASATQHEQPRRVVRDLLAGAAARAEARERHQAKLKAAEQARREARARRELSERLDKLALRTEAAWQEVDELIDRKQPNDYDRATALLKDLAHLADRNGERTAFDGRLGGIRERHARKPRFLDRLKAAGLIGKPA